MAAGTCQWHSLGSWPSPQRADRWLAPQISDPIRSQARQRPVRSLQEPRRGLRVCYRECAPKGRRFSWRLAGGEFSRVKR